MPARRRLVKESESQRSSRESETARKSSLKKSTKKKAPARATRKLKVKKLKLVEVDEGVLVQEEKLLEACKRHMAGEDEKDKEKEKTFSDRASSGKLKTKSSKTLKSTKKSEKMAVQKPRATRKLKLVDNLGLKPIPSGKSVKTPEETKTMAPKRYNEDFVDLLGQLRAIMLQQGEPFRARAYQKAMESIMVYPHDITSTAQIKGLGGVGNITLSKMQEFVDTGKIAKLEKEKNNPINVLTQVYGVGPKKAKELIELGITTIEGLKERQDEVLNDVQKVGLKYLDDINARVPREEIVQYEKAL